MRHRPIEDWEYPDPDDSDDDDDVELVACPHCGGEIYEEAEQCPLCGEYVTAGTSVWEGRSWLFFVVGGLGLLAVLYWSLFPWE